LYRLGGQLPSRLSLPGDERDAAATFPCLGVGSGAAKLHSTLNCGVKFITRAKPIGSDNRSSRNEPQRQK